MTGPDTDYPRVKALFEAVCDLPDAAARRAHLQALGATPALQARVLRLCGDDDAGTDPLAAPLAAALADLGRQSGAELQVGDTLGAWTLCAELGEGGMGRVFLAERSDGHYRQRVAIKLLRALRSEHATAQLAHERQILASLSHPHIARLLDGGTTPGGQPYLVMEHVDGQRIDQHCEQRQLGLAARLTLFQMVCDAVAYSHRELVLHCDIKPGNVLVDGDGRARLLDFGIARLQGPAEPALQAFTPRYASPEQQAGGHTSVASDVYGLGRLLETLLAPLGAPAGQRRSAREVEWRAVIGRATADDPAARYPSVAELQADLRRFLAHLPLRAMPPGWRYRSAKLLRRRWHWVLTGSGVLALSLGFAWSLAQQRDRALQAEQIAREEAATTQQVADLLTGLFEDADPQRAGRPDLSAAAVVDQGRQRILRDLGDRPALQADMLAVLAKVYENMGRPRTAIELWEQAGTLEAQLAASAPPSGPDDLAPPRLARQARALSQLAMVLSNHHEAAKAEAPARQALALQEAQGTPLGRADALNTLGWVLSRTGAYAESRQRLEAALALRRQHLPPDDRAIAVTLHNLALMEQAEGHLEAAEQRFREVLALKQRQLNADDPSLMNTRQSLGTLLARLQRFDEALPLLTQLLAQRQRIYGADSIQTNVTRSELAGVLQDAGRTAEALPHYREVLRVTEAQQGPESGSAGVNHNNLATALEDAGDPAAETHYRRSLAIREAQQPPQPTAVARTQANLGRWLLRAGRAGEARALLQAANTTRHSHLPPSHPERLDGLLSLVELELEDGPTAAAQAHLDEVSPHQADLRPDLRAHWLHLRGRLARRQGQAAEGLALLRQAQALMARRLHAHHPKRLRLQRDLAQAEAEQVTRRNNSVPGS